MAQIDKPNTQFTPTIYSGTSASHAVSVGFQPDLVWLKPRSVVDAHRLMNSVSGAGFYLMSNATNGESASGTRFTSFDTDGFTLGDADEGWNQSGQTYVSWNWLGGGTAVSNTAGSITSSVSSNTDSGFSICTYTGTGVSETIGHGLGAVPNVIIVKGRSGPDAVDGWYIYHSSVGNTKFLELQSTGASTTSSSVWDNTTPTSITFSTTYLSKASTNYVAYCFAEKKGFSKFGSYVGNGNADGTFVYTGFKSAFVMVKRTDAVEDWVIYDSKRNTYNLANLLLYPNLSTADTTAVTGVIDILSNGFKTRGTSPAVNASGGSYIYMAFAENPLVGSNNIPTTAR